ncbi:DNA recombination protein RmuC [Nocardiopsis sp. CNT-189]|uniref:DNA recombination protein RmuC n=1 Tax=Nocardiopsis oceanisediminis TaxID=2816862 RepID=UPI003B32E3D6
MNGLEMIAVLLIGLALGAVLGWMLARGRTAEARADARAAEERAAYIEEQLADRFRALSAQALDATGQRFMELAEGRMRAVGAEAGQEMELRRREVERLVEPLRETLAKVEGQLREADAGRRAAHAELAKQVEYVREGSERLREETRSLVTALRRPEARGRWGELQLRRVAELSGMSARCDFDEQASVRTEDGTRRPDMVVRLAGGKNIVVDSKVSLAAYLEAVDSDDGGLRTDRLRAHARHLRTHVDQLAAKGYWKAFDPAPEFVVLFIPGEAFLAPALEHDPGLLEYAMGRRVHIATPTTLVSLLRTAQYAWQQQALGENAREVFELGKRLHARLSTLGGHVDGLGRALSKAVTAYNQTVGSLESRVLVTARRFEELGLVDGDLDRPSGIEEQARPLASAELNADADAAAPAGTGPRAGAESGPGPGAGSAPGPEDLPARAPAGAAAGGPAEESDGGGAERPPQGQNSGMAGNGREESETGDDAVRVGLYGDVFGPEASTDTSSEKEQEYSPRVTH